MTAMLYIFCAISFFSGVLTGLGATTIFQQIVSAMSFVTASILLIGAAIVGSVNSLKSETIKLHTPNKPEAAIGSAAPSTQK